MLLAVAYILPATPVYAQVDTLNPGSNAITKSDLKAVAEGVPWHDESFNCGVDGSTIPTGVSSIAGKDNVEKSYNYFIGKQLAPHQAAGIVGNLQQEAGEAVNPRVNQGNGGVGRGIAQWSAGGRWDVLLKWAAGRDPYDLLTQLDFIWYEMNEVAPWKQTLPALKAATTVEEATIAFQDKFEKPGIPHTDRRIAYAKKVLQVYGGGAPGQVQDISAGSGCDSSGIIVEGYAFPVAPAKKKSYGNLPRQCSSTAPKADYTDRYGKTSSIPRHCHHDGTPAYDLLGAGGETVYAITNGTITKVTTNYVNQSDARGKACSSIMFKADQGGDKSYYWYGHIAKVSVSQGSPVKAGQPIAKVAPDEYGPMCWGGGIHLHIDRGCTDSKGVPQTGGEDECRDPKFIEDLYKIWEGLPAYDTSTSAGSGDNIAF